MDWRATTSQAAAADLDSLFADSVGVAARVLSGGEFTPFMLVIDADGGRSLRSLAPGLGSDAVDALRQPDDGDRLVATATVLDVTVRQPIEGDAIEVRLEHRERIAIDMLVPYRTEADGIVVDMSAAVGARGAATLWLAG